MSPFKQLSTRCVFSRQALLAIACLSATSAFAGNYEIVKGKGVELCEAYARNLNSFHPSQPLTCERKINPASKKFAAPVWDQVDLENNKRLLWNIFRAFNSSTDTKSISRLTDEEIANRIKRSIKAGSQHLYRTEIDIDNDGKIETVLLYQNNICGVAQFSWGTALVVQYDQKPEVDFNKSDPLMQSSRTDPATGTTSRGAAEYLFNTYGVFIFNDTTYFDKVDAHAAQRNRLYVYSIRNNRTALVCTYRFIAANRGGREQATEITTLAE